MELIITWFSTPRLSPWATVKSSLTELKLFLNLTAMPWNFKTLDLLISIPSKWGTPLEQAEKNKKIIQLIGFVYSFRVII